MTDPVKPVALRAAIGRLSPDGHRIAVTEGLVVEVLFIEDDAMNRRVVGDMLRVAGITMREAPDAMTGLGMIDHYDYDVILMDLRMPGMDGLSAIGHIRARPDAKAELPVIVVTADTARNLKADCMSQGADDLLTKPVSMQDLFDSIGRVIVARRHNGAFVFE